MFTTHRGKIAPALASAVAAALGAANAMASLTIDVRATAVSGGGHVVNSKYVDGPATGSTVTMNVWAQVTGQNASLPDLIQSLTGSFLSSGGAMRGNLSATVAAPFQGMSFSTGLLTDLDGDGDLDIGSNDIGAANYFAARSPNILGPRSNDGTGDPLMGFTANAIPNGTEYRIAQLKFIVTSGIATDFVSLNFRPNSTHEGAVWAEDGSESSADGNNGPVYTYGGTTLAPDTGTELVGATVILGILPEPASIGLLGVAGIGMLARRRK